MSSRRPPRESVYYRVSPPLPPSPPPPPPSATAAGRCSSFSSSTSITASSPPSSLKSCNKSRPARRPGASSTVELGTSGGLPRDPRKRLLEELAWMSRGYRMSERREEKEEIELAGRSEEFARKERASLKERLDCDVGAEGATSEALSGGSKEGTNAAGDFVSRGQASKWYSPRAKREPCCWQRFFS